MIRLAIVGCGGMSRSFVDRVDAIADRVQVTALVDIDRPQAERFASQFAHPVKVATDYREIYDQADAMLLVLPHHLHYPVTMDCLAAGKHVLVEKPMANSEQECQAMIAAARKHQRVLMVAYVMRYHPLVRQLKALLDTGHYGPCFHMSIWTEQFTRFPEGHWTRSADTLGGGQLFSHGCHYIDLLLWFLGRPVSGHHLGTNYMTPWMQREGTSDVAIKFESGAVGYHMGTWGARGTKIGYAIHAHCEQGMLEVDFREGVIRLHQFKRCEGLVEPHIEEAAARDDNAFGKVFEVYRTGTGKQTDKELLHFLDCIETGQVPDTDGPRSLQSLRVIWRMYQAEEAGQVADLRGLGLDQANDSMAATAEATADR